METFYRNMRRHYGILMEGSKPVSGKWNYDHDNREALKKDVPLPEHWCLPMMSPVLWKD